MILITLIGIFTLFMGRAMPDAEKPMLPYMRSGVSMLAMAVFLNCSFYPDILHYQSGNEAAFYINKKYPGIPVGRFGFYMPSGEFYLKQHVLAADTSAIIHKMLAQGSLLFLTEDELGQLKERKILFDTIRSFPEYHITMLTIKFLDPKKRDTQLKRNYLIRLL
jgi:hypothetical protein